MWHSDHEPSALSKLKPPSWQARTKVPSLEAALRLCLEVRNSDNCALKQIHVRIPLKVAAAVMIVAIAEAGDIDHVRKMSRPVCPETPGGV